MTRGVASYPNKRYQCSVCGQDLKTKHDRIMCRKTPNVTVVDGKEYCDRCFNSGKTR